jgi:heptosyltransferase-2
MNKPFRCLVVGPAWVGDMVMAQSLFVELKRRHEGLYLTVLAPAWSEAILQRMPEIDEVIALPVAHGQLNLKVRWKVAKQLKAKQFDQAIVLQRSLKSALVPFFARIPKRTGFLGEQRYGLLNDIRKIDKTQLPMNVQRFLVLADDSGALPSEIPKPALVSLEADQQAVRQAFELGDSKILALCPGAEFGASKQWPARHYASVAKVKLEQGWKVTLLGSAGDKPICNEINQLLDQQGVNLAGRTSLPQVIDLIASADKVVSNDSGLMHIAAALHRPLVAVYGSSSPDFTPPLSSTSQIVKLHLDCQPCFKRQCPLGHLNCLNQLEPQQVLDHL